MPATQTHTKHCVVCDRDRPARQCEPTGVLRRELASFIESRHSEHWDVNGYVCHACLSSERAAYVLDQLEAERGELSEVDAEVSRMAATHTIIAAHLEEQLEGSRTTGQRLADDVAAVGGSWPFVAGFGLVLAAWIGINSWLLQAKAFDPYPYILLNLVLSCLAAIQAPIIMMSQNRASARDRIRADEDYKINLKAELEIHALHEKIDHLLHVQWERMAEIQQTQLEVLRELSERRRS
jgi:uncharacterized membrane protein